LTSHYGEIDHPCFPIICVYAIIRKKRIILRFYTLYPYNETAQPYKCPALLRSKLRASTSSRLTIGGCWSSSGCSSSPCGQQPCHSGKGGESGMKPASTQHSRPDRESASFSLPPRRRLSGLQNAQLNQRQAAALDAPGTEHCACISCNAQDKGHQKVVMVLNNNTTYLCELFAGADSHTSGRIEETSAILYIDMPPHPEH
jgi:hypothetical protein